MPDVSPGKVAGLLPVSWRMALVIGILSMHGLGFALIPKMGANNHGSTQGPSVLQASWIVAASAEAPAAVAPPRPESTPPVRAKTRTKAKARPRTKTRSKPVLATPAEVPGPVAQVVAPEEPSQEDEAPEAGAASEERQEAAPHGASAAETANAAGQGTSNAPIIPPSNANYLSNPRPDYPTLSREQGEQGEVFLHIHVSAEGKTRAVALHKSSGHERLDKAAMEVVWRWRFVPASQGGRPVAGAVIVPIRFTLRS
ncbi:MAG: energy transducer TonB [Azoarcus sp.]|jgi:protein TonB|nr:energy transducer TonB [Azoarcus sp.]